MDSAEWDLWLRRGAAILVAALVGIVAYALISDNGDDSSEKEVVAASNADELGDLAVDRDAPIYWAGPRAAATYEWTELPDGRVYVRYLTGGAQLEDPRPRFLTVGTYPVGDGLATVRKAARVQGARTFKAPDGATALVDRDAPSSVYLAFSGSENQIEVFHPDPQQALRLVRSGQIRPVP